jgi:hypothetical protein
MISNLFHGGIDGGKRSLEQYSPTPAILDYIDRWTAKLTRKPGDKTQHNDSRD